MQDRMFRVAVAACVFALSVSRLLHAQAPPIAGTAPVRVGPSTVTPVINDRITVDIAVDLTATTGAVEGATVPAALSAFRIPITFDNTRLRLVSCGAGESPAFAAAPLDATDTGVANASGRLTVTAVASGAPAPGGVVSVATLTFNATSAGTAPIAPIAGVSLASAIQVSQATLYGPTLIPSQLVGGGVVVQTPAALKLTAIAAPSPVASGGTFGIALTAENNGGSTATAIAVAATIPSALTVVSIPAGVTLSGSTLTWSAGALLPGVTAAAYIGFKADSPAGTSFDVLFTATASNVATPTTATALVAVGAANGLTPGSILAAPSLTGTGDIYDITTGTARLYATVLSGAYIGPILITPQGRVLVATHANGGSVYDISTGGDLRASTPLARNLFGSALSWLEGIAIDGDDNIYVCNAEAAGQRIAKVARDGAVSYLPPVLDDPSGLLVAGGGLLVSEGASGTIKRIDLSTFAVTTFAGGFAPAPDHFSGQLARDMRGKIFVLWANAANGNGLFDVTAGGDFSAASPVAAHNVFRIDVNQFAFDPSNNAWFAGDGGGWAYRAAFSNGTFGTAKQTVGGLGDVESLAVYPPPATASLAASVSASPSPVATGTELVYTITYQNNGGANAANVVITDDVPAGSIFVSATGGGTLSGGTVTWTVPSLGPLASGTVSYTVHVSGPAGSQVTNDGASIRADGLPARSSAGVTTPVVAAAALALTVAGPATAASGTFITYRFTLTNSGGVAANGVVVTDAVPTGATFSFAAEGGTLASGVVRWSFASIAPGATQSFSLVVRADAAAGATITNSGATATANNAPNAAGNSVATSIAPAATVTISQIGAPNPTTTGGRINFAITVTNTAATAAANVVVTARVPRGGTFLQATGGGSIAGDVVTWPIGSLAAGAGTIFRLSVLAAVLAGGSVVSDDVGVAADSSARAGAAVATVAVKATPPAFGPGTILCDDSNGTGTIWDLTTGQRQTFGIVRAYAGPVAFSADGHAYIASSVSGGTIYDVTPGGDLRSAQPFVTNVYPSGFGFMDGMTIDTAGNFYVTNSESDNQRIARITPAGEVSYIGPTTHYASSLLAVDSTLYYTEGGTGTIKALDLVTGNVALFASGFIGGPDHYSGQLALDPRGHMFTFWRNGAGNGLYDITGGGDFSKAVSLTGQNAFRIDVDQIAFDLNNNFFVAGDGSGNAYRALFNASNGTFGPTNVFVTNLGDNETMGIFPTYNLTVAATASPATIATGGSTTFTIQYGSRSIASLANASISAVIPAGSHVLSVSGGGVVAGGSVIWQLGTLPAQATGSVAMTVVADYAAGGTITLDNYSIVADQRPSVSGAPVSVSVVAPTSEPLAISVSASASSVLQGGTIVYTFKFDNENGVAANNVVVRDPLPAGATFLSATNGGTLQNGAVVWNIGTVAARGFGSVSFSVRVDSGPSITNANYTISATGLADGSGPGVTTQVLPQPVLLQASAAAAPSPVVGGQTLTYTIHGTNVGTSTATNATLDLGVPAGLAFASATGGGTIANGRVTWPLGALAPGTSVDVTAAFTVSAAGGATIVLSDYGVASAQSVRVAGAAVSTPVVAPPPPPPLGIVLSATPAQVASGDFLTYQITVTNVDSAAATGVVVTDAVPAGTSLVSTTGPASANGATVQWSLGTLGAGESVALGMTVRVIATAPSTLVNAGATATADARGAAVSNAVETSVVSPPAALRLGVAGPSSVTPNSTITYTLTYANDGPAAVTNALVTDPLPAGTQFLSGGSLRNGIVTWPIGTLAAGASGSLTLVVAATAAPGSTIANSGSLLNAAGAPPAAGPAVLTGVVFAPALFSGTLTTDKTSYTVPEVVHQLASFTYASGGAGVVTNLTATLTTANANGALVASTSQPIASMNADTTVPVSYDWLTDGASSGTYTISFTVTDSANDALVTKSTTISVAAPDGARLTGTLAPTNSPVPLGTALQVHVTINNQNGIAYAALPLEVAVVDPATQTIRKSVAFTLAVGANAAAATDVSLPTAGLDVRQYPLWLTTSLGTGHLLATSTATVIAPLLTLTPPSVTLVAGSSGALTATLSSAPPSPVELSITSADASIVAVPATVTIAAGASSATIPLQGLSIGGPVTISAALPQSFGGAAATSSATVIMSGAVTATLEVYQGETVTFGVTIHNGGQTALNGASFAIEIRDPASGNLVDTIPFTASIAAQSSYTTTFHYATASLAFQKYDARLVYSGFVIASASFEVLQPPPLRLAAAVGGPARVLVWSSCSPGNSGKPCTPLPPPFLTKTLREAGIPYLVVGDEFSFLAAMRTGGFSCAVIDQADPAEPVIAPEYLVDVHAGFGLLFIHSAPNAMPKLAPALATGFLGVLHGPSTLTLAETPFTAPGTLTLNGDGVVITLAGARAAATTAAGDPAISYATYGRGNVVTIPFDLEQTPAADVAQLILSAVGWVSRPLSPSFVARDVVPLQFAVTTPPGGAVPVTVTVTLPAGASVVDALPPLTTASPLQWSATLEGNTTAMFFLWVRLPDGSGAVTVTVEAGLSGGPPVITRTLTIAVASDASSLSAQLTNELAALKSAATTEKDVKAIDDAMGELGAVSASGHPLANVQHLLGVIDALDSLTIEASAARADADRLAVYWQSRVGA